MRFRLLKEDSVMSSNLSTFETNRYRRYNLDHVMITDTYIVVMLNILVIDLSRCFSSLSCMGKRQQSSVSTYNGKNKCQMHVLNIEDISSSHLSTHQVQSDRHRIVSHALLLCSVVRVLLVKQFHEWEDFSHIYVHVDMFNIHQVVVSLCIDCGIEAYFVEREAEEREKEWKY